MLQNIIKSIKMPPQNNTKKGLASRNRNSGTIR